MQTELLIFDLDGTLVDSSADISSALNHAIEPFGIEPVSVPETVTLIGEGLTRLIGKLIEKRGVSVELSVLLDRFLEHYSAHLADCTTPYPGTRELLDALSPWRKAVISNKTELLSVRLLDALNLGQYFDYVAGGDTSREKKPSPLPVLDALAHFRVLPEAALLIGDSIYDVTAGKAAGVRTVAAMYGYGGPGFSHEADFEIREIGELLEIVS